MRYQFYESNHFTIQYIRAYDRIKTIDYQHEAFYF